jgi:hemoglobin
MTENIATNRAVLLSGEILPEGLDEEMIRAVVHRFYDAVRDDDLLSPVFNGAIPPQGWPPHLAKMCDFWSSLLLRTGRYDGRPLPPHLALPGLGEAHFRRWLTLFRDTVRSTCPPEVAALFMDRALRIAHSFRLAIAFRRGEDTLAIRPILEADLAP